MSSAVQTQQNLSPFRKPGHCGGTLIRKVIGFLKDYHLKNGPLDVNQASLPLSSHILIAISGGSDSVGLAHLLIHYGKRIVPRSKIQLLHINHGWRGAQSDEDEAFVKALGQSWGVPVIVHRLEPPTTKPPTTKSPIKPPIEDTDPADPANSSNPTNPANSGRSWEEVAREARNQIYQQEAEKHQAIILTAHQADDLAETLLWRLFTGSAATHSGGIAVQHGVQLRPLLKIRKSEIQEYLKEENQDYREDPTNSSDRFLRARMRLRLMREVELLFPRAIEHLVKLALQLQTDGLHQSPETHDTSPGSISPFLALFGAAGIKARRKHFEQMQRILSTDKTIHLPDGWVLRYQLKKLEPGKESQKPGNERWILEKF